MKLKSTAPSVRAAHQLRIIGGAWRGRKLEFPDIDAIRPTPDRVRETVFNWLQHDIVGARCLDLFAGSGALGFEALSRGAAHVIFVDREPRVIRYVRDTLSRLQGAGEAQLANALEWLQATPEGTQPFDIVFLDPPFADTVLPDACRALEAGGWLKPQALIYLESAARNRPEPLPFNWELLKSKSAGQVGYHLAGRKSPEKTETRNG